MGSLVDFHLLSPCIHNPAGFHRAFPVLTFLFSSLGFLRLAVAFLVLWTMHNRLRYLTCSRWVPCYVAMHFSIPNPVRPSSYSRWGLSEVPCAFTEGSPCVFPFVSPCVPCQFPLTFPVHLLWVSRCLFSSDTPYIHWANHAIHFVARAYPVRSP